MVTSEDSYNTNSHLPYHDIAINDAKTSSIISLPIKQSKIDQDQERVSTKVLIGKTGDDICLINSPFHICQGEEANLGLIPMARKFLSNIIRVCEQS